MPTFVASVEESPRASRALLVDLAGRRWSLTSSTNPRWGGGESDPSLLPPAQTRELAGLVLAFAAGTPSDTLAGTLAEFGIAHVIVHGQDPTQLTDMADSPGLTMASLDADTAVFTVDGLVSSIQISGGPVVQVADAIVPAGAANRTLIIAEPADARLQAWLDGRPLQRVASRDWRQQFALGSGGGTLRWRIRPSTDAASLELAVLAGLLLLGAPSVRRVPRPSGGRTQAGG